MFTSRRKQIAVSVLVAVVVAAASLVATANASTYVDSTNTSTFTTFGSVSDPGRVGVTVDCYSATRTAYVSVSAQTPWAYPNGLYFYAQVLAKAHTATQWTVLSSGPTTFVKSVFTTTDGLDPITGNGPKVFKTMSFTGAANTQYDVLVKFWWSVPGNTWNGPYGLAAAVYQLHSRLGLSYPGSTCYFSA